MSEEMRIELEISGKIIPLTIDIKKFIEQFPEYKDKVELRIKMYGKRIGVIRVIEELYYCDKSTFFTYFPLHTIKTI
jgi:hypothetical protein